MKIEVNLSESVDETITVKRSHMLDIVMSQFLDECIDVKRGKQVKVVDLYTVFCGFCRWAGHPVFTRIEFNQWFSEFADGLFFADVKKVNKVDGVYYKNLTVYTPAWQRYFNYV